MNFLELCQTVRQEVGISGTGPSTVLAQEGQLKAIVDFVVQSEYQINGLWRDWDFLWSQYSTTLALGVAEPALPKPADFGTWDLRSFYLDYTTDDWSRLSYLNYVEWRDNLRQGVQVNSTPTYVVVRPTGSLLVHPYPDKAYTISADYWRVGSQLVENLDVSAIPVQYHRAIIARAKTMWAEREEAPEILLAASAEYQDVLDKLESQSLPEQRRRRLSTADTEEVVQVI
jgi:hypothetical protein